MKVKVNIKSLITELALWLIYVPPIGLRILYSYGIGITSEPSTITKALILSLNIFLLFLLVSEVIRKKLRISYRGGLFICVVLLLFLLLNLKDNGYNLSIFSNWVGRVAPVILVYIYTDDDFLFLSKLKKISYWVIFGVIIFPFTKAYSQAANVLDWQWNYLSYGYNTVINWSCILFFAIKDKHKFDMFLSGIVLVFYIIFSTRMMIICTILTFTIAVWKLGNIKSKFKLVFLTVLLLNVMFLCGNTLLNFVNKNFALIGINSRTLQLFINGKISSSKGRSIIFEKVYPYLKDSILIGHGLGFDRYICGIYVHNFFAELVLIFGLVGAVIIVFCLAIMTIRIIYYGNENMTLLTLIICVPQFIYLQTSSSVCAELLVYFLMIQYYRLLNTQNNSERSYTNLLLIHREKNKW